MRRMVVTMLLALSLTAAGPVRGEMAPPPAADDYDDMQSHPLRVAAYLVNPVGFTLEWLIFRPFHRLVSEPSLAPMFGHTPHSDEASTMYR